MISEFVLVKLHEVAEIFSGNSINEKIKDTKYTGLDDGVVYISTKDIGFDSVINYDNGVRIPYEVVQNFKRAPKDTVFICAEGGSAGRKIAISDRELCFVNKLFAVVACNNVLPKYLYFYFKSEEFIGKFKGSMTGIIGGVSLNKFKELDIKLPPLVTQQKIVAKLDAIFAEIDKAMAAAEANANNAEALFQSYLKQVFENSDEVSSEVKFLDILKLEYGKALLDCDRDEDGVNAAYGANGVKTRTNKFLYSKPSIIIGRKGSAGELTLVKNNFWALDVTYYVTHDEKKTDLMYLYYALKTKNLPSYARGVKPGINRNDVYELTIPLPPLATQQKIVAKLNAISNEVTKSSKSYLEKVSEFSMLKKSILKQAFSGELVKE